MAELIKDAKGEEFTFSQDDFKLVERTTEIHDLKFETKATTFAKDAFKRFLKNKSSVVGAVIIGIIVLLALIVPVSSSYDVDRAHPYEILLPSKVFEAGTGFLDGTRQIKRIPYNKETNLPYDYNVAAVSNIVVYEENGVSYCDFTYDKYADTYGDKVSDITRTDMNLYISNGWCEYDFAVGASSFKILDDRCPIREVTGVENGVIRGVMSMYRYYGYETAPKFMFGTDNLGRDLVKRSFIGLQYSLIFAIVVAAICFIFGLVWGSVSGYFGGNVDLFMERFLDILGGVPLIIIVTLFRLHLGDSLWVFGLSLCISGWMGTASRTRTQFYRFKGREYVLAARTLGASDKRLIFRHVLPNGLGTIVTSSVLMIPSLIFTEASLSYLGLGLNGSNSFGNILSENQSFLQTEPALIIFPAVIISLLMISFNLFGNGLRDALNPSLKGSE